MLCRSRSTRPDLLLFKEFLCCFIFSPPFVKGVRLQIGACSDGVPQKLTLVHTSFSWPRTKEANYLHFPSYFHHNNFIYSIIAVFRISDRFSAKTAIEVEQASGSWLVELTCRRVHSASHSLAATTRSFRLILMHVLPPFCPAAGMIREMAFRMSYRCNTRITRRNCKTESRGLRLLSLRYELELLAVGRVLSLLLPFQVYSISIQSRILRKNSKL